MTHPNQLIHGDCLEVMLTLPDASVDLLLSDWPYGMTKFAWDVPLPLDKMWPEIKRVVKPNGAILLFAIQPFATDLIQSNRKMFRYEIIWRKTQSAGFLNSKKMPLRAHENILVFYQRLPTYNPQMRKDKSANRIRHKDSIENLEHFMGAKRICKPRKLHLYVERGLRYPTDVVDFSNWNGRLFGNKDRATRHPTQKPVDLLEYLIKTYSNAGDTVLDNCAGSGSTGVAAANLSRRYILIEKDAAFYQIAAERLAKTKNKKE